LSGGLELGRRLNNAGSERPAGAGGR
jgi:hypothetical protein